MYSPFLGLASPLFLDPAIYPSPIHTSPDVCLSSGPASTLPKTLLGILLKSLPPTCLQALTMPLLWHLLHCSYFTTSALTLSPRETPGSLTVSSVGPSGPLLTAPVSMMQGTPSSQSSGAYFREPSSVHCRDWVCLHPAPPHPRAEAGKYNSPNFSVAGFFIWSLKGLWHTLGSERGVAQ